MSTIQIRGLASLKGEVKVQGSKNAVLPIMAASILHKGITIINNVPRIQDVFCMMRILEALGCKVLLKEHQLTIDAMVLTSTEIPKEYVIQMRSSIMVLGALLARNGEAVTYFPGGCSIGKRPIDLHLKVLKDLGADILEEENIIQAKAARLKGADIHLTFPSVGATENGILAGVLAAGVTVIHGCAKEPEIIELCQFLVKMGARILGIGTGKLVIVGGQQLVDTTYEVGGDRIVAGTYLTATMVARGEVTITGVHSFYLSSVLEQLVKMGANICQDTNHITISAKNQPRAIPFVMTGPYPGFPTDLQSPLMAALALSQGNSVLEENIFEGRFETVKELLKMGALIETQDNRAFIQGRITLDGAEVKATDLRGGAALVVAALGVQGLTTIRECSHILRGYEDICNDLASLGAEIAYSSLQ